MEAGPKRTSRDAAGKPRPIRGAVGAQGSPVSWKPGRSGRQGGAQGPCRLPKSVSRALLPGCMESWLEGPLLLARPWVELRLQARWLAVHNLGCGWGGKQGGAIAWGLRSARKAGSRWAHGAARARDAEVRSGPHRPEPRLVQLSLLSLPFTAAAPWFRVRSVTVFPRVNGEVCVGVSLTCRAVSCPGPRCAADPR